MCLKAINGKTGDKFLRREPSTRRVEIKYNLLQLSINDIDVYAICHFI